MGQGQVGDQELHIYQEVALLDKLGHLELGILTCKVVNQVQSGICQALAAVQLADSPDRALLVS